MIKGILFFLFLSFATLEGAKPFFLDHERGWFWHEDPEFEPLPEDLSKQEESPPPSSPPSKTASQEMEALQEQLKELKARAILYPTPENVKAYQVFQLKVVNLSHDFSKTWLYNVIQDASLNEMATDPTMQSARPVVYEKNKDATTQVISSLKETYGLFYFYQGNCKFCEVFSPVVQQFSKKYGWEIIPVSLDGTPSSVFENWQPDNGISQKFEVKNVPALFAVNPSTGHIIPVSHGVSSIDQMEERIRHTIMFETQHAQRRN